MKLTVGQLKELIKDMPDETPVISRDSNYELGGAMTQLSSYGVKIENYSLVKRHFRDDFDGTNYSKEVYQHDKENGKPALCL